MRTLLQSVTIANGFTCTSYLGSNMCSVSVVFCCSVVGVLKGETWLWNKKNWSIWDVNSYRPLYLLRTVRHLGVLDQALFESDFFFFFAKSTQTMGLFLYHRCSLHCWGNACIHQFFSYWKIYVQLSVSLVLPRNNESSNWCQVMVHWNLQSSR